MRSSFKILIILLIVFVLGVLAGDFIHALPTLTFAKEFTLGEIADFILAIVVAIVIPVILNKSMDDERHIKDYIIDEFKECSEELKEIKNKIDQCSLSGTTTEQNKKEINLRIQNHGIKVNALKDQLTISFKKKSVLMQKDLIIEYLEYYQKTTGGDLMNQTYNIDNSFCKDHNVAFSKFNSYLKKCIHLVNQF